MKLSVTSSAAQWFIHEFDLQDGDAIKLSTRIYGGIETIFPDYFLSISVDDSSSSSFETVVEGIRFLIDPNDEWLLQNHILSIERTSDDDVRYVFTEA